MTKNSLYRVEFDRRIRIHPNDSSTNHDEFLFNVYCDDPCNLFIDLQMSYKDGVINKKRFQANALIISKQLHINNFLFVLPYNWSSITFDNRNVNEYRKSTNKPLCCVDICKYNKEQETPYPDIPKFIDISNHEMIEVQCGVSTELIFTDFDAEYKLIQVVKKVFDNTICNFVVKDKKNILSNYAISPLSYTPIYESGSPLSFFHKDTVFIHSSMGEYKGNLLLLFEKIS